MLRRHVVAVFMTILMSLCGAAAQQEASVASSMPQTVIRKETRLVLVDAVVTDKKGNYLRDLTEKDFHILEDGKEQTIQSFSREANTPATPERKRHMVLFFDNASMSVANQQEARRAALKYIEMNAAPDRMIAVVEFTGRVRIAQNFTDDADRLKKAINTMSSALLASADTGSMGTSMFSALQPVERDFSARTSLLALRSLAKNLETIPGRKSLVLFTTGFQITSDRLPEINAVISTCNRANVAIYPVDVRGLVARNNLAPKFFAVAPHDLPVRLYHLAPEQPRLLLGSLLYSGDPQQRGAPTGTGGSGPPSGGGTTGGGTSGGGTTGGGKTGGGAGTGTGTTGTHGTGRPGVGTTYGPTSSPFTRSPLDPFSNRRTIIPPLAGASGNQEMMYALALGTGGFVIVNTNNLLAGLEKIGREQSEYYLLGYVPPESSEGSCHELKVKVERGGTVVRSKSGYCNVKPKDLLAGTPLQKQLEAQLTSAQGGLESTMRTPYFFTEPNTARVNLVVNIPGQFIRLDKDKGKHVASVNVLGIAYKRDGSIGGRFSDTAKLTFDSKHDAEEFTKTPFRYEKQFELASGAYDLKVVFSSGSETFGRVSGPLTIDSYDGQQAAISSLALASNQHQTSVGEMDFDAALVEDRTPIIFRGLVLAPSATNRFKKSEKTVIYAEIYDSHFLDAQMPAVKIRYRVFDVKTKQIKFDSEPFEYEAAKVKAGTIVPLGLRLPVDSLPPGQYVAELVAASGSRQTAVRTIDFEVQ